MDGARDATRLKPLVCFFLSFLLDYTDSQLYLELWLRLRVCCHLRTMRKGPNDARHVVWALGEFFLIYSCFFLYTNDFYRYYLRNTGKNGDNGPKRCDMCRLGTRWVFFKFIRVFPLYHTDTWKKTTPLTRICSEGEVCGSCRVYWIGSMKENGPPTRVCSEGGPVCCTK